MVNNTNGIPNFDVSKFVICLIFWAAGNNVTKKNFAIAYLLLAVVMITIGLITGGIFYIGWIVDIIKIATGSYRDGNNRPLV